MLRFGALILSRVGGLSVYAAQKTGQLKMDDNTMYRLMNNHLIDWKSILLSFARQYFDRLNNHLSDAFVPKAKQMKKS
jgi:hypothetical protein